MKIKFYLLKKFPSLSRKKKKPRKTSPSSSISLEQKTKQADYTLFHESDEESEEPTEPEKTEEKKKPRRKSSVEEEAKADKKS